MQRVHDRTHRRRRSCSFLRVIVGVLAVRGLRRRPSSGETATVTALAWAAGAAVVVALLGWIVSGHNAVVDLDHDIASWTADHGRPLRGIEWFAR